MSLNSLHIYKSSLLKNSRYLQEKAGAKSVQIAVVKANAYGLGMAPVVQTLYENGSRYFAVSTMSEAIMLRQYAPNAQILLMGGANWLHVIPQLSEYQVSVIVSSLEELRILRQSVACKSEIRVSKLQYHLAIDTGMGRLGVHWHNLTKNEKLKLCAELAIDIEGLECIGIMSHFSKADEALTEVKSEQYCEQQVRFFCEAIDQLTAFGIQIPMIHFSNSAATILYGSRPFQLADKKYDRFIFAHRPGIALYGVSPFTPKQHNISKFECGLELSFGWYASIVGLKNVKKSEQLSYGGHYTCPEDMKIAILGVGYADGLNRLLSEYETFVCLKSVKAKILGRICMGFTIIDVSELDGLSGKVLPQLGNIVLLLGRDEKNQQCLSPWKMAKKLGTIPYEIMTGLSARLERKLL